MESIYALTILVIIWGIGEVIAEKTKALLSVTLVVAVFLIVGFWLGLPKTIIVDAAVIDIATVLIGILIASLGTTIDFNELKKQWKTVLVSLTTVIGAVTAIILIGGLLIGHDASVAGAPIFSGANVAVLLMTEALNAKGLGELAVFCVLILVTQNYIGIPLASLLLRKEAKTFLQSKKVEKYYDLDTNQTEAKKRKLLQLPASLNKSSIHLAKLGIAASIAYFLASLMNGAIHYFVMALLIGILLTELGFLERDSLNKSQSGLLIIMLTTLIIFNNLQQVAPIDIINMFFPLMVVLGLGIGAVILIGTLIAKIIKESPYLCIAMGLTCTFGFPTTMIMPKEVATAYGKTDKEKKAIENYMSSRMIVAGFVTVTISSVVIAGFVVKLL